MTTAFIFPGQGSQTVGMGRALAEASPAARAVFETVDAALGEALSDIIFNGPAEALTLTANTQPALLAVSIAALRTLADRTGRDPLAGVAMVAGHSLGEYSALVAAGALDLADAARLLRIRGQAMQAAVPLGQGAMAALIGVEFEAATALAAEAAQGEVCQAANDNGGGQVVLSGARTAIDRAIALAPERGIRRALPLPVSAPFHCALMQPAADTMATALAGATIRAPQVPVVTNVDAAPTADPEAIRRLLVQQVTGTVRWRESVLAMHAAGVTRFVEIGAGKVLAGLVKRIAPAATAFSLGTPAEIETFLASG